MGVTPGSALHLAMKVRGLTQDKLAAEVGVKQPMVSKWFSNGEVPPEDRRSALAAAFGVERELIDGLWEHTDTTDSPNGSNRRRRKDMPEVETHLEQIRRDFLHTAVQLLAEREDFSESFRSQSDITAKRLGFDD